MSDEPEPATPGASEAGLHVAVVGLQFGAEFVPIYADHPDVAAVTVSDLAPGVATRVVARTPGVRLAADLDAVLADDTVDAVHLVTGFADHADQTVRALEAGKHVACTVPMALTVADLHRVLEAQRCSGKQYMMMETAVYTREFLYVADLLQRGLMGEISYGRGTHFQDMTRWPSYWRGLPPMFYLTHAVAPLLALLGTRAETVRALGSGRLRAENQGDYGNPFPVETALLTLHDSDVVVDVTRSLYQTARGYTESFSLYGDRLGFEWAQLEAEEGPVLFELAPPDEQRVRATTVHRPEIPDRADLLPASIAGYTRQFVHGEGDHRSFVQGGGHGGSHPHLVHEFVSAVVAERTPAVDAVTAARWTAAGLAAHASAMDRGREVAVPAFD